MFVLGKSIYVLFVLGTASLLFSLVLTPLLRQLALRLNLVDAPDNHRKLHNRPIPRVGGVPIVLSYLGAFGVLFLINGTHIFPAPEWEVMVLQLLPSCTIVFATGLLDDLIGLKPWQKLLGQFAGACFACAMGVRIAGLAGHSAQDWWTVPLTIVWLLFCTNAFNLIDGIDGLAAGVGLFATCTTLLAALVQGNIGLAIATVPMAGCLLGFLRYNFNPASIFLGDCGSLSIGFVLGLYAALWSQKSATLLGMVAPMMALALPLLDVILSIVRRFLNNQPIFGADRGHIHHRLLARGLAPRAAALVLYGVCGIAAILSLLQGMLYNKVGGLVIVLFCVIVCIGVRHLNYTEFIAAHHVVRKGTLRRVVQEEIGLRHFQDKLRRALLLEDYWPIVRETSASLGFRAVELKLHDELFLDDRTDVGRESWVIQVMLPGFGHLKLCRISAIAPTMVSMRLFEILQSHLNQIHAVRLDLALREFPSAHPELQPSEPLHS